MGETKTQEGLGMQVPTPTLTPTPRDHSKDRWMVDNKPQALTRYELAEFVTFTEKRRGFEALMIYRL